MQARRYFNYRARHPLELKRERGFKACVAERRQAGAENHCPPPEKGKYKLPETRIYSGHITRKLSGKNQATRNKMSKEPFETNQGDVQGNGFLVSPVAPCP